MISTIITSPYDIAKQIARLAQAKRLSLNLSQHSLSERSGVSFGVIKKFERTGKISLESLLKMAAILGCLDEFAILFKPIPVIQTKTLDELINEKVRQRGRQ